MWYQYVQSLHVEKHLRNTGNLRRLSFWRSEIFVNVGCAEVKPLWVYFGWRRDSLNWPVSANLWEWHVSFGLGFCFRETFAPSSMLGSLACSWWGSKLLAVCKYQNAKKTRVSDCYVFAADFSSTWLWPELTSILSPSSASSFFSPNDFSNGTVHWNS